MRIQDQLAREKTALEMEKAKLDQEVQLQKKLVAEQKEINSVIKKEFRTQDL